MQGTIVGTVVSTQKHAKLHGAKLLLIQPELPDGTAKGTVVLAIDSVGAGVGERVLFVIEGKAAGDALGRKGAPVDAAIIGIVDTIEKTEEVVMHDDELRQLVRDAVARHLGTAAARSSGRERRTCPATGRAPRCLARSQRRLSMVAPAR